VSADHGRRGAIPSGSRRSKIPCASTRRTASTSRRQFRAPGSYPAAAFDPSTHRLYVAYTDTCRQPGAGVSHVRRLSDITKWSTPAVVAAASGDRINVELSVEPSSRRLDLMTTTAATTANTLFGRFLHHERRRRGNVGRRRGVTKTSWDPSAYGVPCSSCANGVRPFIGDYDGIVHCRQRRNDVDRAGQDVRHLSTNLEVYFAASRRKDLRLQSANGSGRLTVRRWRPIGSSRSGRGGLPHTSHTQAR